MNLSSHRQSRRPLRLVRWLSLGIAGGLVAAVSCTDNGTAPPPGASSPSIDIGPDVQAQPGQAVSIPVAIADSGGTGAGPWNYTIEWGDGGSSNGQMSSVGATNATHTYGAAGQYEIDAEVSNQAGGEARDSVKATVVAPPPAPVVFSGAGDIGDCTVSHPEATAKLLDAIQGTVFTLGDNAYPNGSDADFANCYEPNWGRHKARTHPAPGNHEYNTPGATGYFNYFGAAAGDPTKGYYSYDLGEWHIIVLNSNFFSGSAAAAQEQWLRDDLQTDPKLCTLAMWHHPIFSSGDTHSVYPAHVQLFQILYDADADVVLNGHEHNYERFAPQTPAGVADPARGIREIVAGTGGSGFYSFGPTTLANSEARGTDHGILTMTLSATSYTWEFIPIAGSSFRDSGSGNCH